MTSLRLGIEAITLAANLIFFKVSSTLKIELPTLFLP
jgi:hypothetical protein